MKPSIAIYLSVAFHFMGVLGFSQGLDSLATSPKDSTVKKGIEVYMNCDYSMCFIDLKITNDSLKMSMLETEDVSLFLDNNNGYDEEYEMDELLGYVFPSTAIVSFLNQKDTVICLLDLPSSGIPFTNENSGGNTKVGIRGFPMKNNLSSLPEKDVKLQKQEYSRYKNQVVLEDYQVNPILHQSDVILCIKKDGASKHEDWDRYLTRVEEFIQVNRFILCSPSLHPLVLTNDDLLRFDIEDETLPENYILPSSTNKN